MYVHGLFIEGAIWDRKEMKMGEAAPKILYDTIPVVWLKPIEKKNVSKEGIYEVRLYKEEIQVKSKKNDYRATFR